MNKLYKMYVKLKNFKKKKKKLQKCTFLAISGYFGYLGCKIPWVNRGVPLKSKKSYVRSVIFLLKKQFLKSKNKC